MRFLILLVLFLQGCYQEIEQELNVCKTDLMEERESYYEDRWARINNESSCYTRLTELIRSCGSDRVALSACMGQKKIDEEYRAFAEEECKNRIRRAVQRAKKQK